MGRYILKLVENLDMFYKLLAFCTDTINNCTIIYECNLSYFDAIYLMESLVIALVHRVNSVDNVCLCV